jgi:hypothetical protein
MTTRFTRDDESRDCKYEHEQGADLDSGHLVFRQSSDCFIVQGYYDKVDEEMMQRLVYIPMHLDTSPMTVEPTLSRYSRITPRHEPA